MGSARFTAIEMSECHDMWVDIRDSGNYSNDIAFTVGASSVPPVDQDLCNTLDTIVKKIIVTEKVSPWWTKLMVKLRDFFV